MPGDSPLGDACGLVKLILSPTLPLGLILPFPTVGLITPIECGQSEGNACNMCVEPCVRKLFVQFIFIFRKFLSCLMSLNRSWGWLCNRAGQWGEKGTGGRKGNSQGEKAGCSTTCRSQGQYSVLTSSPTPGSSSHGLLAMGKKRAGKIWKNPPDHTFWYAPWLNLFCQSILG